MYIYPVSQMIMLCMTVAQYRNQNCDICRYLEFNHNSPFFVSTHLYVCVLFRTVLSCMKICVCPTASEIENCSIISRHLESILLQSLAQSFPPLILAPANNLYALHFYHFVILRMLHKRNLAVYYLLELFFSLSIVPLRWIQVATYFKILFLFITTQYSIIWIDQSLYNYSPVKRTFRLFSILRLL